LVIHWGAEVDAWRLELGIGGEVGERPSVACAVESEMAGFCRRSNPWIYFLVHVFFPI
jgi:hypothetical protein